MEKENRLLFVPFVGKTSGYRQKEGYQNNKGITLLPRLTAVLPPQGRERRRGFTLIELLVVVLIIGILAAVALPQYQKTVLKSRYSSLIPLAKALRDGNEVYYLMNSVYTSDPTKLDITTNDTNAQVTLGNEESHKYVRVTRPDIKNNYIMYQKHSANFPGEIHCEAEKDNKQAEWLCKKSLKGSKVGGSLTEGYVEYIIEGTGSGVSLHTLTVQNDVKCTPEEQTGTQRCSVTTNSDGSKLKTYCSGKSGTACVYTTYNNDGTTTRCSGLVSNYIQESCHPNGRGSGSYESTYDENNNLVMRRSCLYNTGQPRHCSILAVSEYDVYGNEIFYGRRDCSGWDNDGICNAYSGGFDETYTYDDNGKKINTKRES